MTRRFLNASMELRKGVIKVKLVRAFIAFVVVSLFVGISSAFNGQDYVENQNKESTKVVEKVEVDNTTEEIPTEIVDNNQIEEMEEEQVETNNSFSASKRNNVDNSEQEKSKTETKKTQPTATTNQTTQENKQPVEVETEITNAIIKKEEQNSSPENNSNNDDIINSTYYSITKGNPEYPSESACKSAGLKIQNKELDAILDWNEEHPDNPKSHVIGSSMCIIVMKDRHCLSFFYSL